jgi:hypothetical protein
MAAIRSFLASEAHPLFTALALALTLTALGTAAILLGPVQ